AAASRGVAAGRAAAAAVGLVETLALRAGLHLVLDRLGPTALFVGFVEVEAGRTRRLAVVDLAGAEAPALIIGAAVAAACIFRDPAAMDFRRVGIRARRLVGFVEVGTGLACAQVVRLAVVGGSRCRRRAACRNDKRYE